jgi:putative membrane-bound dehydrogenase-like protein
MIPLLLWLVVQEPMTPQETAAQLQAPDGFAVTLFAGEPDVQQPISFAFDDRGRLWVAEAYSYPKWDPPGRDRILVFEDTDGDGKHDTRKVFFEGLTYVTGIEVGFGGVWVIAPPQMFFIPDRDGDDRPDGPPEVLLDGFGLQGGHNIANGFTWGPDGWLYAGHGRTSISDLGKPGTPADQRLHFDGGVWRYHPTRHVVEAWADGTTNPWGVAFDDRGQAIITNCVNPHLFHAIQGAHYEPWRGRESSRFAYKRIDSIADHLHWVGRIDQSRGGAEVQLAAGGGHAHCGCMVYLGDSFPDSYRNTVMTSNLHGKRINNDLPRRQGSGFTAAHGKDFLISLRDRMFMALHLNYGPDGAVTLIDWYDRGECHTRMPHRETGRIYKVTYTGTPKVKPDLAKLSNDELVRLQLHKNDWYVTHARRLLQERKADVAPALLRILDENPDETRKLRALWALHATGTLTDEKRASLLSSPHEYVRAWAIQLEAEDYDVPAPILARWVEMSKNDPSPVVRLYLASAIRRLPFERTLEVLSGLASHVEDAVDPNLPLMVWYAAWPMAEKRPDRALAFIRESKIPLLREFMTRQIAMLAPTQPRRMPADPPVGTVAFGSLAPRGWDVFVHDRQTGKTTRLTEHPANDYNAVLTMDGRRIAFVSERDGNGELYVANADGSSPRRLTESAAYDDHAAWSPDGRSILFSSTREAASRDGQAWNALYVMSADGTGVQRVSPTGASDYSPAWYGWGDVIACATGSGETGKTEIVVMKPDGSERRKVADDGGWPTFARGRLVYFHSKRDGSWGVWRASPEGTGLQRVTPPEIEASMPRGSSHAQFLAMVVKRGAHRQIEVMDLDSRKITPITTDATDHWNPSLSSDGRFVTWHQATPGKPANVDTWTVPDGTKLRMLSVLGPFPAFAPDGKRLALVNEHFSAIDVMGLDGADRKTIFTGTPRGVFSLSWSRGDDRIAFSRGGAFQGPEGQVEISSVKADGSEVRDLTKGSGNNGFPSFSPDGSRLVFRSGRDGSKNLYTMKSDGSEVRRLTEGKWTDTMGDWSPAGDWIVFASDRGGEFEIWVVKPDGNGLHKLVAGGGKNNHPHFSPDGKWVVFTSQRAGYSAEEVSLPHQFQPYGDLFAIRLDGRDLLRLTHTPFEEGTPAWGP